MPAKIKTFLIIVFAICCSLVGIFVIRIPMTGKYDPYIFTGGLFLVIFGYVFGVGPIFRFLMRIHGIKGRRVLLDCSFFDYFCEKGFFWGLVTCVYILIFLLLLSWIPGIIIGIKAIHSERSGNDMQKNPADGGIKKGLTVMVIFLVIVSIVFVPLVSTRNIKKSTEKTEAFDNNGFVFSDSNTRSLTKTEVENLKKYTEYSYEDLINFSINEIYARQGGTFKSGGKFEQYYNQYSWYRNIEKKEVTENMLNRFEKNNIDLLVKIAKENGYR